MKAYYHLTIAQLRLFARNKQVLFFSLFFPILLMLALGSFLGGGNQISISAMIVDQDKTEASAAVVGAFMVQSAVQVKPIDSEAEALEALKRGDTQLVVVVPAEYGKQFAAAASGTALTGAAAAAPTAPAQVLTYYDEKNLAVSQMGITFVNGIVDALSKQAAQYVPVVAVHAQPVESLGLEYIDFLVPGIVAMMIMSSNLNGVAGQIASWRERGVLRRMQSTTLKARTFIAAQITARLLLNGSQAVIVLLIGWLVFGTQVMGSWPLLLFYVILGTLVFMSIGFIIAGLAKTPESAGPIAGLISFPLMFLGNVFFPVKNMPEFIQPIVKGLPITQLSDALREVMNVGAGLTDLWMQTAWLAGWLVVSFIVATYSFRWE
jgi:ABC-2 type transport system permease protein